MAPRKRYEMNISDNQLFNEWIKVKKKLHYHARTPYIKEGEVWWAAVGENIGVEINGKSQYFSRPVVIFKKLSKFGFMGILSTARLYNRLGQIAKDDLSKIKTGFRNLYLDE